MDFFLGEYARHLQVGIDAIDGLDIHLQVAAVAVARIGEPDSAVAFDAHIVGTVVAFAVIFLGQDFQLAGFHVGAHHAAAARSLFTSLTADEPALGVEDVAVGPAAVGAEDAQLAFA